VATLRSWDVAGSAVAVAAVAAVTTAPIPPLRSHRCDPTPETPPVTPVDGRSSGRARARASALSPADRSATQPEAELQETTSTEEPRDSTSLEARGPTRLRDTSESTPLSGTDLADQGTQAKPRQLTDQPG
jgi:hypothetical protein